MKRKYSHIRNWHINKFAIHTFIITLANCLLGTLAFSQVAHTLPQVTPKSPNVAAMEKYVDVPVNLSTGMIKLDIPLFTFKVGDVTIPITLNYANNGLKTDEIPTWVGLGWSLSCGGVISYQQRGLNDFDSLKSGLFHGGQTALDEYFAGKMPDWKRKLLLDDIVQGNIDAEYDLYNYFLPNANGIFYFTSPTQVRTLPKADIIVNTTPYGFKIKDDNGNDFYFEAQEFISTQNTIDVSPDFFDNSSYYLTKIVAKNGSTALFKYKTYNLTYYRNSASIFHTAFVSGTGCPNPSVDYNSTITRMSHLLLDSAIFPEGYIKFVHSATPRKDLKALDTASKAPALDKIEIYNINAKKIKTFQLYTSYFGDGARLKLDSLSEIGGTQIVKKWKMDYNNQPWASYPAIFSRAKDHWGYFNGNSSFGAAMIPNAPYSTMLPLWRTYSGVTYVNKQSDSSASILGTLKSIEYPGGGKSEFTYEANQVKVKSYTDILSNSAFLELPASALTEESIVSVDLMDGSRKTGSFTIPEDGLYKVDYFYETCSDATYGDASVGLPPGDFSTGFTYTHDDGWWHASGVFNLHKGATYDYTVMSTNCVPRGGTSDDMRYLRAWLTITHSVTSKPKPYQLGGCRISTVKTYSGITADTIIKKYIYEDSLQNVNFKQYPNYITTMGYGENESLTLTCLPCGNTYRIHDESVVPLVGPIIEYSKVHELTDQNGVQGKIDHNFMVSENKYISSQPYVTPINTYWRSGNEVEKNTITNAGKNVQTVRNGYQVDAPFTSKINGIKVDYSQYCTLSTGKEYNVSLSTLDSEAFHSTGTSETMISDTNQIIVGSGYSYTSANHVQPTEIIKTGNNKTIHQKIKYAFDYSNLNKASTTEAKAIKNLVGNRINSPIEQIDIVEKNGNQFVTGGTLTIYNENGYVIDKIYQLKLNALIPVASFSFSTIDPATGVLTKDQHYIPGIIFSKYDAKQNIIEQQLNNDKIHSYIWDYKQLYPIAEAINTSVNDIAYTSFEADGSGGLTGIQPANIATATSPAPTGNKVYQLTTPAPISKTVDASKKYIVSYWSNSGAYTVTGTISTTVPTVGKTLGIWKYYEHIVTGVSTISINGSGLIDEVRLYPKGATMATYTYEPLIGISSKCDADNRLLYYEYDEDARLKLVRDQNKNIIAKYDYQQQLNCNAETSRTFTKNDCSEGYKGSSVVYTIPAGKYCSADIAQMQRNVDNEFKTNGQTYANVNGTCIAIPKIHNVAISKTFSKTGCSITAEVGSDIVYTVPAGKYFSYISQDSANAKAMAEINANGQAYANANGSCNPVYVTLSYENNQSTVNTYGEGTVTADLVFKFYKDAAHVKPYTIRGNLTVNFSRQTDCFEAGTPTSSSTTPLTITCNGASTRINNVQLYNGIYFGAGDLEYCSSFFSLEAGTGYK